MRSGASHPGQDFLQAVMSHLDMLHTLARRLTRNRQDAEDLVQEVMMRAFAASRRQDSPQSMGAWLATICLNTARSAGRRQQARPPEYHDDNALARLPAPTDTDLAAIANIEAEKVQVALAALAPGQRQAITLINLCGFSTDEVARMLGVPRGTVLSRLHRGHQALAARLADRISR